MYTTSHAITLLGRDQHFVIQRIANCGFSEQANQEYKQAEIWFQRKVQELEAELDNAR